MATTITTAIASTVTLAAGYTTVTATGTIKPTSSGGYAAIAIRAFSPFTLVNAGLIQSSFYATNSGIGVEADADGTIINSGRIFGSPNSPVSFAIKKNTASLVVVNSGIISKGSVSATTVTNLAGGSIDATISALTISNQGVFGTALPTGVGGSAILSAFKVTNAATGVMLLNGSTISSGGAILGTLINAGSIGSTLGITLRGNSSLNNAATGTIRANSTVVSAPQVNGFLYSTNQTVTHAGLMVGALGGVVFGNASGSSATLINTGTIVATTGYAAFFGVPAAARLVVGATAAFSGVVKSIATASTLELQAPLTVGTISGIGTSFVGFNTIQIDNGATASQWRLNGSAAGFNGTTISGWDPVDQIDITDQTVTGITFAAGLLRILGAGNAVIASITLSGSLVGITNANQFTLIGDGGTGTVIRQSGLISGTVSGTTALVNNKTVTVASTGTLSGGAFPAVSSVAGVYGTLINAGLVTATYRGVTLAGPATVSNLATGTIAASYLGSGAYAVVAAAGAVISNAGRISGVDIGVQLTGVATVSNLAGGVISGTKGVDAAAGGTVINAGTISSVVVQAGAATIDNSGTIQNGFTLVAGVANRVIARSGAVFGGTNNLGSVALSTLELASGAATASFAGLPSNFASFGNIVVDPGASWTMGDTTIAAGTTLTDNGTLKISGTLTANGVIAQNGATAIVFNGANNRLILAAGASVSGQIDGGTTPGSVLEFGTGTGTLNALVYGFTNIVFDAGAQWTIKDAGSDGVTNRTLTGFNSTDRFDFTSRAGGVLSGGGNNFTLTATNGFFSRFSFGGPLASQYATSMFSVTADGTGGTNVTAPGLIGSSVSQNVTLSGATFAVTSAGTLTAANSTLAAVQGAASTVNTVLNAGIISGQRGVLLTGGGYVDNIAGGLISGYGTVLMNAAGSVANAGTIRSNNYYNAVDLAAGGLVTNAAGGLITALKGPTSGGIGVRLGGAVGTVNNAGTISSTANLGGNFTMAA
ncbi:MAG: hypothetical protein H7251_16485 [Acetobacteraceae bacterium]|nr:hypothetical protein [Acetobacteraceae bacterium]